MTGSSPDFLAIIDARQATHLAIDAAELAVTVAQLEYELADLKYWHFMSEQHESRLRVERDISESEHTPEKREVVRLRIIAARKEAEQLGGWPMCANTWRVLGIEGRAHDSRPLPGDPVRPRVDQ